MHEAADRRWRGGRVVTDGESGIEASGGMEPAKHAARDALVTRCYGAARSVAALHSMVGQEPTFAADTAATCHGAVMAPFRADAPRRHGGPRCIATGA